MEGVMVTPLKDIEPNYYKYFIYTDKRGRNFMYEESKKAVYGTIEASINFWENIPSNA